MIITEIDKLVDHYDIGKPKYGVIDLQAQKLIKTYDIAKEDESGNGGGRGGGFEIFGVAGGRFHVAARKRFRGHSAII